MRARGVGAREHAGVGKRDQGDGAAAQHDRGQVGVAEPRYGETGQPLRDLAQYLDAAAVQAEQADGQRGQDDGDQDAGQALEALEQQDEDQGRASHRKAVSVGLAVEHGLRELPEFAQRAAVVGGDGEQLGQLARQHDQRDAVHVAVADGLGQQLGDESQPQQAQDDAEQPGDDGHEAGRGHRAHGVALRDAEHDREDGRGQRRIRTQDEDAAGAEQRVGEQRDDGGVQAIDARHARRFGIGDAHRHQHGREHQAGGQIARQPGGLVGLQYGQSGQPAQPASVGRVGRGGSHAAS
ncbi:Uncharacterised protein [Bordetella pertussis]|nr:Uncharacterised protein [Bordetella pertussis]CFM15505.1 Uncharacterised protein [Bordetella pertussis]CFM33730.1 Uncharacterised protein [Bordetella pertussis]CFM79425.1 Uncharacterised protein [Bordetella pertussis]CFN01702.1 Uncharacterised protein [Bordetella pertussis]